MRDENVQMNHFYMIRKMVGKWLEMVGKWLENVQNLKVLVSINWLENGWKMIEISWNMVG